MFPFDELFLALFIIVAFIWDVKFQKMPKLLIAFGVLSAFFSHIFLNGVNGLIYSFIGVVAGTVIGLILYFIRAVSTEDVMLLAIIGSFQGIANILYTALYTIFFAIIIGGLIWLVTQPIFFKLCKRLLKRISVFERYEKIVLNQEKNVIRFPFMYAVLPAVLVHYINVIS